MDVVDNKRVIGPDLLWDLGYRSLTRSQVTDLLYELYDTLEWRVGVRLSENLDANQLARFERIVDGKDESAALGWLRDNIPDFREITAEEFDYVVATLGAANRLSKSARQEQASEVDER